MALRPNNQLWFLERRSQNPTHTFFACPSRVRTNDSFVAKVMLAVDTERTATLRMWSATARRTGKMMITRVTMTTGIPRSGQRTLHFLLRQIAFFA